MQQFHSWILVQRKRKHQFRKTHASLCSLQHYLQQPRDGSNVFFFFSFQGPLVTYGGSQAKGQIGATAYTTATATWDLSRVYELYHSSWQHQILNPLNEARDQTCIIPCIPALTLFTGFMKTKASQFFCDCFQEE